MGNETEDDMVKRRATRSETGKRGRSGSMGIWEM